MNGGGNCQTYQRGVVVVVDDVVVELVVVVRVEVVVLVVTVVVVEVTRSALSPVPTLLTTIACLLHDAVFCPLIQRSFTLFSTSFNFCVTR